MITNSQTIKKEFINSIYNWLMKTLETRGKEEYKDCFKIEGSSIIVTLPSNYFNAFEIKDGQRIEMKFIAKS